MFHQDKTTLYVLTHTISLLLLFTLLAAHNTQPNITHSTDHLVYSQHVGAELFLTRSADGTHRNVEHIAELFEG